MTTQLAGRLAEGLDQLGLSVPVPQRAALLEFVGLLVKWNSVYNLTSVRNPEDMLAVHILDALSIINLVDEVGGTSLLDVGSGAGIPGIPLAIVRPELRVSSVDAVAKKIGFQTQAKATLRLENFQPFHQRVEALTLAQTPAIIISRAYAEISTMLASVAALVDSTATIIAMKGTVPAGEIAAVPPAWTVDEVRKLDVPFLGAERCAVVLRRVP